MDSREVIFTERATAQRAANARPRDANAALPSSVAPHSAPALAADHESNHALLLQIISMLAGGAPARPTSPVRPRPPTPARHVHAPAWERRSRSPHSQRNTSQHLRQSQNDGPAARRFNSCYVCGRTHFPYCRRSNFPQNQSNSPRGRTCDRRDRGKSVY
jgi:hypothetical protein